MTANNNNTNNYILPARKYVYYSELVQCIDLLVISTVVRLALYYAPIHRTCLCVVHYSQTESRFVYSLFLNVVCCITGTGVLLI